MKIKEKFVDYSKEINPGRLSFFIDLDRYGMEIKIEDIIKEASNFSNIVLDSSSDDIMYQKDDVLKFIKGVVKINDNIKVDVFTYGVDNFKGFIPLNNMTINVRLLLSKTEVPKEFRIYPKSLLWYSQMNSNILFDVDDEDDLDEANMLVHEFSIKKNCVFICLSIINDDIKKTIKAYGFNIGVKQ